jgi:hypothetical protein
MLSSSECKYLKKQLNRIEALLVELANRQPTMGGPVQEPVPALIDSEKSRLQALRAEGHFILSTQGIEAYKKFWQQIARKEGLGKKKVKG